MATSVKLITHSVAPDGTNIATIAATYPYVIHAQLLMHRAFSRNSQSNRAIPTKKLIDNILANPYNPVFRANQPGMVAGKKVSQFWPQRIWSFARSSAILAARLMSWAGVHKETVNRLLLPFSHITTLITSTEWDNFFELRIHDAAQPEIQELADKIKDVIDSSTPWQLKIGQWHLPYVTEKYMPIEQQIQLSVARCARVSYLNHDKSNPNPKKDLELYHDLITSKPVHGSPAEHQATPMDESSKGLTHIDNDGVLWSNNFRGWIQYRALLKRK